MAIIKRYGKKSGWSYQVKFRGSDGRWITETADSKVAAEKRQAEIRLQKLNGGFVTNLSRELSVSAYFKDWHAETKNGNASEGWRKTQIQMFRDYVNPVIGHLKMQQVNPAHGNRVLGRAGEMGRSPSVKLHIYNLMHKMFGDAVELYEILPRNPIIKKLRPKVPYKETKYLELDEVIALLRHVEGKPYQVAIWLQIFAGLRAGEVQYLRWEHVDLKNGIIHVRGTYLRKEGRYQDHPKGRKWHRVKMPPELWDILRIEKLRSITDFVAVSPDGPVLRYGGYVKLLKRYCTQAGVPVIPTHGLRHSTSELYMAHGASRDDLRLLFAHSCSSVTDRYVHDKGRRLDQVAENVFLFRPRPKASPEPTEEEKQNAQCSQNVPKLEKELS